MEGTMKVCVFDRTETVGMDRKRNSTASAGRTSD